MWTVFVLLVLGLAAVPVLAALMPPAYRLPTFSVHLAVVLAFGGLFGQLFVIPLPGDVAVSGGSLLYGSFMMSATMLLVVTGEIGAFRRIAYLVVGVNGLKLSLFAVAGMMVERPGIVMPIAVPGALFDTSIRFAITGGVLIIIELLAIVAVMERWRPRRPSGFASLALIAFMGVVVLDGLLFPALSFPLEPALTSIIAGNIRSKAMLAVAFGLPLGAFMWLAPGRLAWAGARPFAMNQALLAPRDQLLDELRRQQSDLDLSQQEQARLRDLVTDLLGSNRDGFLGIDADECVTFANRRAQVLLDTARDNLVGAALADLMDIDSLRGEDGAPGPLLVVRIDRDGAEAHVEVQVRLTLTGGVVFLRDVTAEALQAEHLERAEHADRRADARIRELDRAKSAFLTATSHELRTPLTVIEGVAETLTHRVGMATTFNEICLLRCNGRPFASVCSSMTFWTLIA